MASETTGGPVLYSVVLRPHRSSSIDAIRLVSGLLAVVWLAVGGVFIIVGAWPVMPFLGLEVLLIYGALRLNHHTGNTEEAISLTERALTVRRLNHWGRRTDVSFPPNWLQVNLAEPPDRRTPLELRSHGRSLVIGSFLLPEERWDLARALRRELSRLTARQART